MRLARRVVKRHLHRPLDRDGSPAALGVSRVGGLGRVRREGARDRRGDRDRLRGVRQRAH